MQTTTLVEGRWFCEGPRRHDERFWLSDFHAHEICSVGLDGVVRTEVGLDGDERPSGLGWLPDGTIAVHADPSGVATLHCNDMLVDSDGRAYVGNFGFDLDSTTAAMGPEGLLTARRRPDARTRTHRLRQLGGRLAVESADGGAARGK